MKKMTVFLTVFCIALLTACSSPWRGSNEGTITIAFGTQGRVAVQEKDIPQMTHHITLTGPGETITETISGVNRVNIPVAPGTWNISVRGYGPRPDAYCDSFPEEMLRGLGSYTAEVRAGETSAAGVRMISAAEVSTAPQLASAIDLARDDGADRPDGGEKIIIIMNDIAGVAQTMTVAAAQNITLAANSDVAIRRAADFLGDVFYGELRFGRDGMTGKISVEELPVADINISFAGIENKAPDMAVVASIGYLDLLDGELITITVMVAQAGEAADFYNARWFIGEEPVADDALFNEGRTLTLNYASFAQDNNGTIIGNHRLRVVVDVYVDGMRMPFSRTIIIEVTL